MFPRSTPRAWMLCALAASVLILRSPARCQTVVQGSQPAYGVEVYPSSDPHSAAAIPDAATLLAAPDISDILKYAVILQNDTPKDVAAYCLEWTVVGDAKPQGGNYNCVTDASVVLGEGRSSVLPARRARLIAPVTSLLINSSLQAHLAAHDLANLGARARGIRSATFALDGVVLADGSFVGTDEHFSYERMSAKFKAEHDVAVYVSNAISSGATPDSIGQHLSALVATLPPGQLTGSSADYYSFYSAQCARQYLITLQHMGLRPIAAQSAQEAAAPVLALHRAQATPQ